MKNLILRLLLGKEDYEDYVNLDKISTEIKITDKWLKGKIKLQQKICDCTDKLHQVNKDSPKAKILREEIKRFKYDMEILDKKYEEVKKEHLYLDR